MPAFISPIRMDVSKAFPLASFNVRTGRSPSWFEVVLTTDPDLLRPDKKAARTPANFFTSRVQGPLSAERGEAVYIVPPAALARFAGQPKLYYALATYARPDWRNPDVVTIRSDARAYLRVSQSFTGSERGLTGIGSSPAVAGAASTGYGDATRSALVWGGDDVAVATPQPVAVGAAPSAGAVNGGAVAARNGSATNGSATNGSTAGGGTSNGNAATMAPSAAGLAYDDGFDTALWSSPGPLTASGPYADPLAVVEPLYQPSDPIAALRFMMEWLGRGLRWRAGVPDTRIIPHSAICQLRVTMPGGTGIGTGFYISRDRILTCAHNVHGATSVKVIPGRNGSEQPFGSFDVGSSQFFKHPQYVPGGNGDYDLAVIKVTTPPPNGWFFDMLEALNQSRPSPVIVCGYAAETVDQDKQHLDGDAVVGLSDNMERLQYNIQTEPGNSGSPVFYVWGYEDDERQMSVQDIRIIAVHISAYDNQLNQACRLTDEKIAWIWSAGSSTASALGEHAGNGHTNGSNGHAAVARATKRALGLSVGVSYDVPLIPQPDKLSCWAASMAMILGYRRQQSITPESLAQEVGRSLRTSYSWDMLRAVRDNIGFETISLPSNASIYISPEEWYRWLCDYGPLWVTTVGAPSHAIVIAGMSGDLTPDGTTVEIVNPWDTRISFDGDAVDFNPFNPGRKYSQRFSDFAQDFGNLGLGNYGDWRVLYLPASAVSAQGLGATALSLDPLEPDGVERMRQAFIANRTAASRQNCITIMNSGMRALYGARLNGADGRPLALGSAVHETMGALQRYGLAQTPTIFEFNNAQGRLTYGVARPDRLRSSIESWMMEQIGDPQMSAWYLFGLSIMDGYHSVTLAVAFSGQGDPLTRVYWADQHYDGWTDTTGQVDARITELTQSWWDGATPKPRTRVTLWPLMPASTPMPSTVQGLEAEISPEGEPHVADEDDPHGDPALSGSFGFRADAFDVRPWRVAGALLTLRTQVNARFPGRNKASDGTIGDAAHAARSSDHNPWVVDGDRGVVTAMDITHDPDSGCTGDFIAGALLGARDARIKYLIWNRQIASSYAINGVEAWCWRPYNGSNPHTHHIHISVNSDKALYDDTTEWSI
jgi:V8-like Glu-specific endopeptidase